ncbi:putative MFS family arabinose efflux permease [Palleronia aestuarii]|uniref:Putative MFS family arabinose efflux permease n=2 Tax=Palleronia aestuarii TaxID=568105 RepID=A0A2W7MSY3_9RHOB|nr:putative MFS family arabinose efflux permease [Palleronia aestuarii]
MIFSLVSGAIADGYDRRRVIMIAQAFMFAVSLALVAVTWAGLMTPAILLVFTFLIGCGTALNNPSWQASIGDIVGKERLGQAVLLNSVSFNVVRSVGPAVGGAIIAAAGSVAAFGVNALTYLPLLIVLFLWRPVIASSGLPREPLHTAMTSGMRYVLLSPEITRVMLRAFLFGISTVVVLSLLPLYASQAKAGALGYGLMLGAFGGGAVAGAFGSTWLRARLTPERLVRTTFVVFAASAAVIGLSPVIWVAILALPFGGAAWVVTLSLFNTTVQLSSPRWVVGRALSLYQMATFGGMALGAWAWGSLAEAATVPTALLVASVVMLLGSSAGIVYPLPERFDDDLDPHDGWRRPKVELDLLPRSGPISISVDYEIDDDALDAFLDVMRERRRIRLRNGAHSWVLTQNLENHRLWQETFKVPTWTEYLRYQSRTTQADAEVTRRLRQIASASTPSVQRAVVRDPMRTATRNEASAYHPPIDIA